MLEKEIKMDEYKMDLIDSVIAQIKIDIDNGNYDAIAEMLDFLQTDVLKAFLPESENLNIQIDNISHIGE